MSRIGNRRHAEYALNIYNGVWNDPNDEWKNVGSGASRVAYLHKPTDVVYKIASGWAERDQAAEVRRARALAKEVQNNGQVLALKVPPVSLYRIDGRPIVAMPFVKGEVLPYYMGDSAWRGRAELFIIGHFNDMHNENFRVDDDANVIPIDFGSKRRSDGWDGADHRLIQGIPHDYIESVKAHLGVG